MLLPKLLLLVSLLRLASPKTQKQVPRCSLECSQFRSLPNAEIYAKCKVFYPLQLNCSASGGFSPHILANVSLLDLSQNGLIRVPTWLFPWCKSLKGLSLARNNLSEIESGAFSELRNLLQLNLSFNSLREWTVNYSTELTFLYDLDVTGNEGWLPNSHLTHLTSLHVVRGVAWTKTCRQCVLARTELFPRLFKASSSTCPSFQILNSTAGWPWHEQIKYGRAFSFIKVGFWPTCLCTFECYLHEMQVPLNREQTGILLGAMHCLYGTGSLAILLNIAVIVFVAIHRRLRKNLAIQLICNVAVCDVLTGLFSIIYARFNHPRIFTDGMSAILDGSFENSDADANLRLRNAMGVILTCAVTSQVLGGFIMTFEKFLKIVFTMKPNWRIGRKFTTVYLLFAWSLGGLFAILPIYNVGRMTYISVTMATPLPSGGFSAEGGQIKLQMSAAAGTQILLVIVQLAGLILYFPIFAAAKKSGASFGVKTEARIAKKIALLVLTNFVIFTIPVVFSLFQDDLWHSVFLEAFPEWQNLTLTNIRWVYFALYALPALCFSVNSILNPLIYAVRHPRIKQHLKAYSTSVQPS